MKKLRARDPARVPVHSWFVQVFGPPSWRVSHVYPMPPSALYTRLLHAGWGQHGLSSRPLTCRLCIHFRVSLGTLKGAATELYGGTLKLRYSSSPFFKRFPSWPVSDLTRSTSIISSSPVSRFHSLDGDPVCGRSIKRFRITGECTAGKRVLYSSGEHPTPQRWKRLILQGLGRLGGEVGSPPDLFPRIGVG